MDASAHLVANGLQRNQVVRLPEELSWNTAFELLERLAGHGWHSATVSFSHGLIDIETVMESGQANVRRVRLDHRVAAANAGVLGRMLRFGPQARFSAATFVPAFLTFLDSGCRIGLTGDDPAQLERLRSDLSHHAPWHQFVALGSSALHDQRFDLMIVSGAKPQSWAGQPPHPSIPSSRLVIFAGNELVGFGASH